MWQSYVKDHSTQFIKFWLALMFFIIFRIISPDLIPETNEISITSLQHHFQLFSALIE